MSDKVVEAIEIQNFEEATIENAKKVMQNMFNDITPEQFEELKKQAIENVKQNNMSAKEMFEKLGYKERKEEFKNDKIFAITYADYKDGNWIKITKETIEVVRNRTNGYLSVSTLPAINKQIEELGWNK